MKKIILLLLALIGVLVFLITTSYTKNPSVTIKDKTFYVDVAKTDQEKEKGLSVYDSLPISRGMVFPFEKADYYGFWMKNMKFPIDIIYIRQGKIVDIFKNVPPPKSINDTLSIVKPRETSDTVLEINAGLSDRYGYKIGDYVKINY